MCCLHIAVIDCGCHELTYQVYSRMSEETEISKHISLLKCNKSANLISVNEHGLATASVVFLQGCSAASATQKSV